MGGSEVTPEVAPKCAEFDIPVQVKVDRDVTRDEQDNLTGNRIVAYQFDITLPEVTDPSLNVSVELVAAGNAEEAGAKITQIEAFDGPTIFEKYYTPGTDDSDEESTASLNAVISTRLHTATNLGIISGNMTGGGVVGIVWGAVESNNYWIGTGIFAVMAGFAVGMATKISSDIVPTEQENAINAAKQQHTAKRITDLLRGSFKKSQVQTAEDDPVEAATEV